MHAHTDYFIYTKPSDRGREGGREGEAEGRRSGRAGKQEDAI